MQMLKNTKKDHALFEDEVDEFQELNDSLVAVAAEGKVMVKENDVATIETFPIESAEIEELAEVPIKVDEPRKPLPFKDMVAIAKPSEPIVQSRPSKPVKPSEPIGKPEITNNPGPVISYESKIPETMEPSYPEQEEPNDVTTDIPSESVEPGEPEADGNPTSSVNQVAMEEPVEEEMPMAPSRQDKPVEQEIPLDPSGPEEPVEQIPIDPTSPEEQIEQEIPVDPLSPDEQVEQEIPVDPLSPEELRSKRIQKNCTTRMIQ